MKIHVCLIDDDPDELDIFMDALSRMGMPCKCTSAKSGEHALQMLGHLSPDFIFLDLNMPRMSGLECLVEIRKMHRFDKVPVILYSTGMNDGAIKKALALGATACLPKTTDIGSLVGKLSDIIHRNEAALSH